MSQYQLAKEILSHAFPEAAFSSQAADLWQGPFPLPTAVAEYYLEVGPSDIIIESYGNPFFLPSLVRLWQFQAGYRYHPGTDEHFSDWDDDWLVIAGEGADPFIYSRESGKILHAIHGQGVWEPTELFTGLSAMVTAFAILGEVVIGAGEDFTDEKGYIKESYRTAANKRMSRALQSTQQAEVILESLGWG